MENNKKKRKSKKIFLAILMILFTGVILTTSTYAWFTANKTVSVSNIDLHVAASDGLQLSADATNWKTIVNRDDLTTGYSGDTNQLPAETGTIVPVSSIGEVDTSTGFMKMFKGTIESAEGNYVLTATPSVETRGAVGDFVAFDIFFMVTNGAPIYLTANSSVKAIDASTGIENASRVAFVIEGNAAAGTDVATIQKLKTSNATADFIWEPNFDVHTAAGVSHANDVYHQTTQTAGGGILEYYGVKAEIPVGVALDSNESTYFTKVVPDLSSPAAGITPAYPEVFTLQPGITKVRVYMWVEGQDVDCENNASGGGVSYNLQFSLLNGE